MGTVENISHNMTIEPNGFGQYKHNVVNYLLASVQSLMGTMQKMRSNVSSCTWMTALCAAVLAIFTSSFCMLMIITGASGCISLLMSIVTTSLMEK